jgi:MFS family permease
MLISSQYYTRSEQAPRFTVWYMGLGVAQILGGLISFGFQHVHHASMEGWRIMFLVLGLVTSVVGALTFFFIPDTPMKASWLSDSEKVALLEHVSENQTGVWSTKLNLSQILEALCDVQLWLLTVTTILVRLTFHPLLTRPDWLQLTPSFITDLCLQRCSNDLFVDLDCRIWVHGTHLGPPQHARRHCQHLFHASRGIRYP